LPRDPRDARLVKHRAKRTHLLVGRKHRRAHQPPQIGVRVDQFTERFQVGLHLRDGVVLQRKLKQRRRITTRHAGNDSVFACHALPCFLTLSASRSSARRRRKPLELKGLFPRLPEVSVGPRNSPVC
jgi:hypothetical protein